MSVINDLMMGFAGALTPWNLLMCFLGVFAGQMVGALPGIGPSSAIALLLPLTFGADPTSAIILFAGIYYGAQYGGTLTSVLISVPGEPSSVMTSHRRLPNGAAGPGRHRARHCRHRLVHRGHAVDHRLDAAGAADGARRAGVWPARIFLAGGAGVDGAGRRRRFGAQGLDDGAVRPAAQHRRHRPADRRRALCLRPRLAARRRRLHRPHRRAVRHRRGALERRQTDAQADHDRRQCAAVPRRMAAEPDADPARVGDRILHWRAAGDRRDDRLVPRLHRREEGRARIPRASARARSKGVAGPEASNNAAAAGAMVPMLALGVPGSGTTAIILGALDHVRHPAGTGTVRQERGAGVDRHRLACTSAT